MNEDRPEFVHAAVAHGALDYAELERLHLQADEIIDFSVNANVYGPSPRVREAIAQVALDRYPDRACLQLRRLLLAYELPAYDIALDGLVCGNGSSELIWTIAHAFLKAGDTSAIIGPTFGEYALASRIAGAHIIEQRAQESQNFVHHLQGLLDWLQRECPRLVWLCNPNNPTGTYLDLSDVERLAQKCAELNAMLIVDESYMRFVWPEETAQAVSLLATDVRAHVMIVRSLTKDFALAGVRLGYAIATVENVARVSAYLPSWNVSALAQAAGCAAIADRDHLAHSFACLLQERAAFFRALRQTGLSVVPSRTHFCLLKVGDARLLRQRLLMRRLLVRDGTSFALPAFIRVATRPAHDWQMLIDALWEVAR